MDWVETTDRFVGYFDIMGFKDMVYTSTHEHVLEQLKKLSIGVKALDQSGFGKEKKVLKTTIFSDSIILVTDDNSTSSAAHLMISAALILEHCFEIGIPIRGCLSYGKFTADFNSSLFFGKPLIDAYSLEGQLNLYSCVIHHTMEKRLSSEEFDGKVFAENIRWFRYKTPLKGGNSLHFHINWLFYANQNKGIVKLVQGQVNNFYKTVSGATRQYVDNTEDFIKELFKYNRMIP